jgi:hypothetical protein
VATYTKPGLATGRKHNVRLIRATFVHIVCKDPDGKPLKDHPFELELADGEVIKGKLDKDGLARHENVLPGECKFKLIFDRAGQKYAGEPPEEAPPRTHTIKLRLEDEDGTPFANCRYLLKVGGQKFDGRTTDKGVIVHDVPSEAENGQLHFWAEDGDDAEEMVWPLKVRDHLA